MGAYTTIIDGITKICKKIALAIIFVILVVVVAYKLVHFIQKVNCTEECNKEEELLVLRTITPNLNDINLVKSRPTFGSTIWNATLTEFYPDNFVLITFEDGHIMGQVYAKYEKGRNNDYAPVAHFSKVGEQVPISSKNDLKQKLHLGEPTKTYNMQGIQLY